MECDEQALTNSTPTSKDVVLPAWIADQLQDIELVVVVCNICLRTLPHNVNISAQHWKWRVRDVCIIWARHLICEKNSKILIPD
jgi:hypothetical protein